MSDHEIHLHLIYNLTCSRSLNIIINWVVFIIFNQFWNFCGFKSLNLIWHHRKDFILIQPKIKIDYRLQFFLYINKNRTSRHFDPESWDFASFTVFGAAGVWTRVLQSRSANRESVVVTTIHPILSPEYLRYRETSQRANEHKRRVIGNWLILELSINFRRTWVYNSKVQFKKGKSMKKN